MREHPLIILQRMISDFRKEAVNSNEQKIIIDLNYDIEPMFMYINEAVKEIKEDE